MVAVEVGSSCVDVDIYGLRAECQAANAIADKFRLPGRALRVFGMGFVSGDSSRQVEEDGGRMLVSGDWITKCNVAQMLQRIREREIARISGFPQAIALGKFFRSESREAEQIVGAVFDHVDAEIVAGKNLKIRAVSIAQL